MRTLALLAFAATAACSPGSTVGPAQLSVPTPTGSPPSSPPAWTANPSHVFYTGPGTPDAKPCRDQAEVEELLREFATAFNGGQADAIEATLSTEFWAVSIGLRGLHQVAYARQDAVRFILERQRAGDRLEFVRTIVNGPVGWDGAAHVGPVVFALERDGATIEVMGKGALFCGGPARGIKVIGLGD